MTDPAPERRLGPYRLKKVIGRGGMGTVYAAVNEADQQVALKVLAPVLTSDSAFRQRFMAEIESLKKLKHPNIVQLFGYGEQDGQLFYSMELIDGTSLQQELNLGRRFEWREVTQIAIDVCAALKHAHDHGVIHRDLKPANLLYTRDERVKLLDFGIAKLFGNPGVTTGSVLGTADYMAPEQAEGKAVSARTDLYSLGAVMYALLSGQPPFVGKSVPEVVHKVRYEPPIPISRRADDVPPELEQLIEQLLEKNPQSRIPTSLALSHRLRAMEHALSIRTDSVSETTDHLEASRGVDEKQTPRSHNADSKDQTVRLATMTSPKKPDGTSVVDEQDEPTEVGPDHYTPFSRTDAADDVSSMPWQALGSLALLVGLITIGWVLVRQVNQPEPADDLYALIRQADEDDSARAILRVADEINTFLESYPHDQRAGEVEALQEEVELAQLQRKLELKARRRNVEVGSPIEQLYLEITRQLRVNRPAALRRLDALVNVCQQAGPDHDFSPDEQEIIRLAARQLARMKRTDSERAKTHGPLIQSQLARAQKIEDSRPEAAAAIRENLKTLYGSEPWARKLLEDAR